MTWVPCCTDPFISENLYILYPFGTGLAAETISPENNCGINDVDKALECVGLPSLFINVSDYNAVVRQACR